jgi:F-type H+-transporting ATPase subunit b
MLAEAERAAADNKLERIEQARHEADLLRTHLMESVQADHAEVLTRYADEIKGEVFGTARKVLEDLASASLEEQIIAEFLKRVEALSESDKKRLVESLMSSAQLLIRTAFELTAEKRDRIAKTIVGMAGKSVQCTFEVNSNVLGGIELVADGYKVSWSISEYLNTLKGDAMATVNTHAQ